jgi:hypothetical protein
MSIEVANEQAADPQMKTVMANRNSFLRPYRSPSFP